MEAMEAFDACEQMELRDLVARKLKPACLNHASGLERRADQDGPTKPNQCRRTARC